MDKHRLQSGSVIVEVIDDSLSEYVLLKVSKERFDEDAVQISLARPVAQALGNLLRGNLTP